MSPEITYVLQQYTTEVVKIYDPKLKEIILYGSYARGDNREDSDIDIMIYDSQTYEILRETENGLWAESAEYIADRYFEEVGISVSY